MVHDVRGKLWICRNATNVDDLRSRDHGSAHRSEQNPDNLLPCACVVQITVRQRSPNTKKGRVVRQIHLFRNGQHERFAVQDKQFIVQVLYFTGAGSAVRRGSSRANLDAAGSGVEDGLSDRLIEAIGQPQQKRGDQDPFPFTENKQRLRQRTVRRSGCETRLRVRCFGHGCCLRSERGHLM